MGIYTSFLLPTRSPRLARALIDAETIVLGEDYLVVHDTVKWGVVVGDPGFGPRFAASLPSALAAQLDPRGICAGPDLEETWGDAVPPTYDAAIAELGPVASPREADDATGLSFDAVWLPTSSAKARTRHVLLVGVDESAYQAVLNEPGSIRGWIKKNGDRPPGAPEVRFGPLWVELQRRLYDLGHTRGGVDDERLDAVAPRAGLLLTEGRRIDSARLLDGSRVRRMTTWLSTLDDTAAEVLSRPYVPESPRARDLEGLLGTAPSDDVDPPYASPPPAKADELRVAFDALRAFYGACEARRLGLVAVRYRR